MRTFVFFALALTGTAIVTDDAFAFGRRRRGCDECDMGMGYGASWAPGYSTGGAGCGSCGGYSGTSMPGAGYATASPYYPSAPCSSCGGGYGVSSYGGMGYGYGNSYYGAGYPAGYGTSMYGNATPSGYVSPASGYYPGYSQGAPGQGGVYNIPSPPGGVPQNMPAGGNNSNLNNPNVNPGNNPNFNPGNNPNVNPGNNPGGNRPGTGTNPGGVPNNPGTGGTRPPTGGSGSPE